MRQKNASTCNRPWIESWSTLHQAWIDPRPILDRPRFDTKSTKINRNRPWNNSGLTLDRLWISFASNLKRHCENLQHQLGGRNYAYKKNESRNAWWSWQHGVPTASPGSRRGLNAFNRTHTPRTSNYEFWWRRSKSTSQASHDKTL